MTQHTELIRVCVKSGGVTEKNVMTGLKVNGLWISVNSCKTREATRILVLVLLVLLVLQHLNYMSCIR